MDAHFYKTYFKIEKEHWLMRVRRSIVMDVLEDYRKKVTKNISILDFGCGSGLLVKELSENGYCVTGMDVSKEAILFGRSQGINNLIENYSQKIDFPDNSFDVVCTLDVLEHLEKTDWALREMCRVLSPGGILIIMVPAYMFLWGVQDEIAHHYRRYTKGLLIKEIKDISDFKIVRMSYFNTFLFFPIACVRVLSRWLMIQGRESDFDINSTWMNKIFFTIFNFERRMLKRINFPFGVSILGVLKKK